jgi:hemoglobin-like flavoprotein
MVRVSEGWMGIACCDVVIVEATGFNAASRAARFGCICSRALEHMQPRGECGAALVCSGRAKTNETSARRRRSAADACQRDDSGPTANQEPSMTPSQIKLVRADMQRVKTIAPLAASLFYDRLFALDPSLRRLFRGDMAQQGERLMQMIGAAVGLLDRPHALLPVLRSLGARHAGYGVREAHYATVGAALLGTLQQAFGDAFDAEHRAAWAAMYGLASGTMMEAAREAVPA